MSIKYVRNFSGLGIAGEITTVCDDEVVWAWTNLHIKVYFGSWIWLMNFKVSKKRKVVSDETFGKNQQADRKD